MPAVVAAWSHQSTSTRALQCEGDNVSTHGAVSFFNGFNPFEFASTTTGRTRRAGTLWRQNL